MELQLKNLFAIWAISISSVETITLSINLFSKATLIDQYIKGLPQNNFIFFLGIPLEPPLAGIKAIIDI